MTQPTNLAAAPRTTIKLADPGFPAVMRVVSAAVFPEPPKEETKTAGCPHCQKPIVIPVEKEGVARPLNWIVGVAHPIIPDMLIIRMFRVDDGIEVYSVKKDNTGGMRHVIPERSVLLVEEAMPLDVFANELQMSEDDAALDDGEDEEDEEEETFDPPATTPQTTTPNGQSAS